MRPRLTHIALFILGILFTSCHTFHHPYSTDIRGYEITDSLDQEHNPELNAMIEAYKIELDKEMNVVIGKTAQVLEKAQPEGRMCNLVADIIYDYAASMEDVKLDFAVANYEGLRLPDLPEGDITRGKIFELAPFDNYVVVLRTPGTVVQQFCDKIAFYGGWPVSGDLNFVIDGDKAVDITIKGEALDEEKMYEFATVDYIAAGGDDCFFLKDYTPIAQGTFLRSVIIEKFEQAEAEGKIINAHLENRITIKE